MLPFQEAFFFACYIENYCYTCFMKNLVFMFLLTLSLGFSASASATVMDVNTNDDHVYTSVLDGVSVANVADVNDYAYTLRTSDTDSDSFVSKTVSKSLGIHSNFSFQPNYSNTLISERGGRWRDRKDYKVDNYCYEPPLRAIRLHRKL